MNPKELTVFGAGAALALVVGLNAGSFARAPLDGALDARPMAAAPGTPEAADVPSLEAAPATPPPAAARTTPPPIAPPRVYSAAAPVREEARLDPADYAAADTAEPGERGVQARAPGQDYARRDLGGPEEITLDEAPPPDDWRARRRPPPPPPPDLYAPPQDEPD
jgi:WAS/WASL-interacting protein